MVVILAALTPALLILGTGLVGASMIHQRMAEDSLRSQARLVASSLAPLLTLDPDTDGETSAARMAARVRDYLSTLPLSKEAGVVVMSAEGGIIAQDGPREVIASLTPHMFTIGDSLVIASGSRGAVLALGVAVVGRPYRVVIAMPRQVVAPGLTVVQSLTLILAAGMIAMILSAFAASRLEAPLQRLLTAARALATGNTTVEIPLNETGEVGELAAAFQTLVVAMDRTRDSLSALYQSALERVRELSMLHQTSTSLARLLPPPALGQEIIRAVQTILPVQTVTILLLDEHSGELIPFGPGGQADVSAHSPWTPRSAGRRGVGIPGWVALTGELVRTGDVRRDSRYKRPPDASIGVDTIVSELCVPIKLGDRILGVIDVASAQPDAFTAFDERVLATLAAQVAIAMENSRLYSEARERQREAEVLQHLSETIAAQFDLDTALHALTQGACELLHADLAAIALVSSEAESTILAWRATTGTQTQDWHRQSWEITTSPTAARLLRLAVTPHAEGPSIPYPVHECPLLVAEQIATAMAIPLASGGTAHGLLLLGYRAPRHLDHHHAYLGTRLAAEAITAIEHVRMTEAMAQARAAQEADRLKSELLSIVSHELRTPLSAIKGYADALERYDDDLGKEERLDFTRSIMAAADRLHNIVANLLDLSRLEAGVLPITRTPLDLKQLVTQAIEEMQRRAGPQRVVLAAAPASSLALADPARTRQVLDNLLDNALKYAPADRPVTVRIDKPDATQIVVSVHDDGPGIPADEQGKLFTPFYRTTTAVHSGVAGTGLGLAICKKLVEAQGGRIWLESTVGHGATFYVALEAYVYPRQ